MASVPPRPEPITLDDLYAAGLMVGGQRAVRIVCEMPDGGQVVVVLGIQAPTERDHLAPWQMAVRQAVAEMPIGEVFTAQKLADKAGYANTGNFRAELKRLEAEGVLEVANGLGFRRIS